MGAQFRVGAFARGVLLDWLRPGSLFRRPRIVLSSLACMPSVGASVHGGFSMASIAPSYSDRASSLDLSEFDGTL
jgi:hypothetical protein